MEQYRIGDKQINQPIKEQSLQTLNIAAKSRNRKARAAERARNTWIT